MNGRPLFALLLVAERRHIIAGLDGRQRRIDCRALAEQQVGLVGGQQGIRLWYAVRVGEFARIDHRAEGLH